MIKAILLDRDGVINKKAEEHEYITCWNDFVFLTDVFKAIQLLNKNKWRVIIVTNQQGIAKGLMTVDTLIRIHLLMNKEMERNGCKIDSVFFCPHGENERCYCRKPEPGLLLKAKDEFNLDLKQSFMVGDSLSDILAGVRVRCKTILINGHREFDVKEDLKPDYIVSSLYEAAELICKI